MATYTDQLLVYVNGRTQKITASDDLVINGAFSAASFSGSGASLTSLNASNLSSGTVDDARLSSNVAFLNAVTAAFSGAVTATSFSGSGASLTNLDASNVSSGTLGDAYLSSNVAKYNDAAPNFSNTVTAPGFSGSGASLTSLNASNLSSGTVADARLSSNVAKYDDAAPNFDNAVTAPSFSGSGASLTSLNASNLSSGTVADARLSSNVPLKNAASNAFSGDFSIGGSLTVAGPVYAVSPVSVVIGDNFLDLNAGNTLTSAEAGGMSVSIKAEGTAFTGTDFVAGVAATSNPVVTLSADPSADFATGDLIQISGSTDAKNDGQFVVLSVDSTSITVKGIGTAGVDQATTPFAHNQFVAQTSQTATVTKAYFSVLAASNGLISDAVGTIPEGKWAQAYGATEAAFTNLWIQTDPNAGLSLQTAYNGGSSIELTDGNAFSITIPATGNAGYSLNANASSALYVLDANLTLRSTDSGRTILQSDTEIVFDGRTSLPGAGYTQTFGPNTTSLAQYTVVTQDASGNVVAADAGIADVIPVGAVAGDNYISSVSGTHVRVLGETGTSWAGGAAVFLSSVSGQATNVPPTSGRVYRLGVAIDSFDASVDSYALIRWNPQYIADL